MDISGRGPVAASSAGDRNSLASVWSGIADVRLITAWCLTQTGAAIVARADRAKELLGYSAVEAAPDMDPAV